MDTEKYVESFKTNLMDAVYAWASKKSFAEVLELSETYEGLDCIMLKKTIIRLISVCCNLYLTKIVFAEVQETFETYKS